VGWGINIRLQKEDERSKGIRPLAYGNAGITDSGGFVHLSSCSLVRGVPQTLAWPHLRGHAGGARGARHRAAVWGQGQQENGWVTRLCAVGRWWGPPNFFVRQWDGPQRAKMKTDCTNRSFDPNTCF
jgi:hypothetical protein